jgi:hypothetical protein
MSDLQELPAAAPFECIDNREKKLSHVEILAISQEHTLVTVTERAAILGHSVDTNLKHYSFDPRNSLKNKADKLNDFYLKTAI